MKTLSICSQVPLLLTACRKDEHTCEDGTCINNDLYCDAAIDCPDESDEKYCSIVQVPSEYSKDVVPPRNTQQPLHLYFFITITSIRTFDLATFTIAVDAVWYVSWHDSRLSFLSLQGSRRSNTVKDWQRLWKPELMVTDGTNSLVEVIDKADVVQVTRESPPVPDNDERIAESK